MTLEPFYIVSVIGVSENPACFSYARDIPDGSTIGDPSGGGSTGQAGGTNGGGCGECHVGVRTDILSPSWVTREGRGSSGKRTPTYQANSICGLGFEIVPILYGWIALRNWYRRRG
jgi:hypothetical protein